jgi:uncharacterized protein YkwD
MLLPPRWASSLALFATLACGPLPEEEVSEAFVDFNVDVAGPAESDAALRTTGREEVVCQRTSEEVRADPQLAIIAQEIVRLTNVERVNAGLAALKSDDCLANIAQSHTERYRDGDVSAASPHIDGDGNGPAERVSAGGWAWTRVAENIHLDCRGANGAPVFDGAAYAQRAVSGWMRSAGHRANLMNPKLELLGVGVSSGVRGTMGCFFATQLFLRQ